MSCDFEVSLLFLTVFACATFILALVVQARPSPWLYVLVVVLGAFCPVYISALVVALAPTRIVWSLDTPLWLLARICARLTIVFMAILSLPVDIDTARHKIQPICLTDSRSTMPLLSVVLWYIPWRLATTSIPDEPWIADGLIGLGVLTTQTAIRRIFVASSATVAQGIGLLVIMIFFTPAHSVRHGRGGAAIIVYSLCVVPWLIWIDNVRPSHSLWTIAAHLLALLVQFPRLKTLMRHRPFDRDPLRPVDRFQDWRCFPQT